MPINYKHEIYFIIIIFPQKPHLYMYMHNVYRPYIEIEV